MTQNITISVIVPVFNLQDYIERCLFSISNQTFTDLEIIVVNDGSVDDTEKIVRNYMKKDLRVRLISQENKGVSFARLKGVQEAKGNFVGFVDGDDVIESDMYEMLYSNALQYKACISHCGYKMVFPSGREDYYYNTGQIYFHNREEGLEALVSGIMVEPSLCNKLYQKRLFDGIDEIFDFNLKNFEDLYLNYLLFKRASSSVFEDKCLYCYILRRNSATTKKTNIKKKNDPLVVLERIYNDSADLPAVHRYAERRMIRWMVNLSCLDSEEFSEYSKEIRNKLRKNLFFKLFKNDWTVKDKIKVLVVTTMPTAYRRIHQLFKKITKLDKKYSLEN